MVRNERVVLIEWERDYFQLFNKRKGGRFSMPFLEKHTCRCATSITEVREHLLFQGG
jgi:hypothetical protein